MLTLLLRIKRKFSGTNLDWPVLFRGRQWLTSRVSFNLITGCIYQLVNSGSRPQQFKPAAVATRRRRRWEAQTLYKLVHVEHRVLVDHLLQSDLQRSLTGGEVRHCSSRTHGACPRPAADLRVVLSTAVEVHVVCWRGGNHHRFVQLSETTVVLFVILTAAAGSFTSCRYNVRIPWWCGCWVKVHSICGCVKVG